MPTREARRARKLIAHGLLHWGRRPRGFVSGVFSMSFAGAFPFAVRIKPRGEAGEVRSDAGGFSIVTFPLRGSGGRQLTLLDCRFIDKEGRRSALRRRSSWFAGCADEVESLVLKRAELTRGGSVGEASSPSDDPDECLLIPVGAVAADFCPEGGTMRSRFRCRARPSEGTERCAAVKRSSWAVSSVFVFSSFFSLFCSAAR